MKKIFLIVFLGLWAISSMAQIISPNKSSSNLFSSDTTSFNKEVQIKLDGKTTYTDYKIISINFDTTYVDTTLTINKDFKFNYLRKDNFELLPFHNLGQTFNKLAYSFENSSLIPSIGANAKQYNYYTLEDVKYYHVPTPTSEFMYKTGLEQGQVLDAFLTLNTSKQLNLSIAYKGLRSLGKYRYSLASHGNFRTTFNYQSKKHNYFARGHFSSFDLSNNENGGLTAASIQFFENNDPNYIQRSRLDVNFIDADNLFEGKRYYLEQKLTLFSKKNNAEKHNNNVIKKALANAKEIENLKQKNDTLQKIDSLAITFEPKIDTINVNQKEQNIKAVAQIKKDLKFKDKLEPQKRELTPPTKKDSTFLANKPKIENNSEKIANIKIDSTQLIAVDSIRNFEIKLGHTFMYETQHYRFTQTNANDIFGDAFNNSIADHTSYQKMDNQVHIEFNAPILGTLRAKGNYFKYNYHYNSILYFDTETINDKLKGNFIAIGADWHTKFGKFYLNADAKSIISGDLTGNSIKADATVKKDSIYGVSVFIEVASKSPDFNKLLFQSNYINYNWQNNFKNEELKNIGVKLNFKDYINIEATYNKIDNYTYFNETSKPVQATETLNYLKVKANSSITYRKFTIDNTVMYQKVDKGDSFFRVPEIITRNTLYYSNYFFKGKPLYLQTGVTFKYFTAFNANAYNPLLSEFTIQNETEIGNFPILDFFVNMQVRRTRLYFKVENFTASFTGRNYYSAPNYPYRDLIVRFGLVWNFFI